MPQQEMQVDWVGDLVCPWCYVAWHSFKQTAALRPQYQFNVLWRPFLLDPQAPANGADRAAYYAAKFGGAEDFAEKEKTVAEAAARLGAPMNLALQKVLPNTVDAHRVVLWAYGRDLGPAAVDALYAAYFVEGRNLSDPDVLAEIAGKIGLEADLVREALRTDDDRDIVFNSHQSCVQMGIEGVPVLIFDSKTAAMGANQPEAYAEAADKAAA
jgi:predicted DsbA family dithiol-disulfide isomerase